MSSRTLKGNRFSLIALFEFSAPALCEATIEEANGVIDKINEKNIPDAVKMITLSSLGERIKDRKYTAQLNKDGQVYVEVFE